MAFAARTVHSEFGEVGIVASARGVVRCVLPSELGGNRLFASAQRSPVSSRADEIATLAASELTEFLAGGRREFSVPLDWSDASAGFAGEAQRALLDIPFGRTEGYGVLAARLGRPGAARAVGTACARNPLALFVPCHRVVRADGAVGHYAGGAAMKRWLLELEAAAVAAR